MRIELAEYYCGKLTHGVKMAPGIHDVDDNLGEYLLEKGVATEIVENPLLPVDPPAIRKKRGRKKKLPI